MDSFQSFTVLLGSKQKGVLKEEEGKKKGVGEVFFND